MPGRPHRPVRSRPTPMAEPAGARCPYDRVTPTPSAPDAELRREAAANATRTPAGAHRGTRPGYLLDTPAGAFTAARAVMAAVLGPLRSSRPSTRNRPASRFGRGRHRVKRDRPRGPARGDSHTQPRLRLWPARLPGRRHPLHRRRRPPPPHPDRQAHRRSPALPPRRRSPPRASGSRPPIAAAGRDGTST